VGGFAITDFHRRLGLVLFLALVLRVLAIPFVHADGETADEREFVSMALRLHDEGTFVDSNGTLSVRAPLFPGLLALLLPAGGRLLALSCTLFLGVLVVAATALLARSLWDDERAALAAGILAAFYPGLVTYAALLQTETLYLVLLLGILWCAGKMAGGGSPGTGLLLGALGGLAALTRAVFLPFFPALLALLWSGNRGREGTRSVVLAALVCIAVLLPWTLRNARVHDGALVPVSSFAGTSLLMGNNPFSTGTTRLGGAYDEWVAAQFRMRGVDDPARLPEVRRAEMHRDIALDYMMSHPGATLLLALRKLHVFLVFPIAHSDASTVAGAIAVAGDVVLWGALGVGILFLGVRWKRAIPLFAAMLFFTATHVVLHAEARYRLPLMPIAAIIAGGGVAALQTGGVRALVGVPARRRWALAGACSLAAVYGVTAWMVLRGSIV
jgi:4-amino-4-deoxy-L-arabinose transferase-like glycosyltransferase